MGEMIFKSRRALDCFMAGSYHGVLHGDWGQVPRSFLYFDLQDLLVRLP